MDGFEKSGRKTSHPCHALAEGANKSFFFFLKFCFAPSHLLFCSWTKSKGTITVHKALMTLGGRLVAKLKWSTVLDEIARVETERAEITVYCSIIRTVLRGGDAAAYGAWNLFALLSAFCCHVGPKDELYCLSDFVTPLKKQFESEKSRAFTHHFKSVRKLEPMHDTTSCSSSIPFLDDEIQVPPSPLNVRAE